MLELGSRNVNGSARTVLTQAGYQPRSYTGIDLEPGKDVDLVWDVAHLDALLLTPETYDVVLSTEMLEHVKDWRLALSQMEHRLQLGGLLVLTTRSPGFEYHPWPLDCWRFTVEDMQAIFAKGWRILHLETDPDPGQRRPAPYYGVGIVAQRIASLITSALWEEHLQHITVHEAP